jgi:putative FmdB family regulatory protein
LAVPTYEYRRPDGSTFEVVQSFSDDPLTRDPDTGVPVQRVLHAPAVHFKGKGFYSTDYAKRKREPDASGDDGSATAKDSTSDGAATPPSTDGGSEGRRVGAGSPKSEGGEKSKDAKPLAGRR